MTPEPYTQADRFLKASCEGQPPDRLLLEQFTGTERVSGLFTYTVNLLSEENDIDPEPLLGKHLSIEIDTPDGPCWIDGLVRRFVAKGWKDPLASYQAEVVAWPWFLSLSHDCRVFQNKSVPDIVEEVFKGCGFNDYRLSLTGQYDPREYCVQYRESALNFVSRLLEDEGIFYHFDHEKGKHTLVLSDDSPGAVRCLQGIVRAAPQAGRWQEEDVILGAQVETSAHAGKVSLTDYFFETPDTDLLTEAKTTSKVEMLDGYEIYDFPGSYEKKADGKRLADLRIAEEETLGKVLRGKGNCRSFRSGFIFTLDKHFSDPANRDYFLIEVRHQGSAGWTTDASETGLPMVQNPSDSEYNNEFVAIPDDVQFRPRRLTRRPRIAGTQTAVVVGKKGEEIFTDKHGRVKVQFHWDRKGKKDEASSCWVRVSTSWAGKNWGAVHLPRMGHEVVVSFLEGDPDRPLVTGSVYNADQPPPYDLPGHQTQSGIKSRTSKGGGTDTFNELRFEDLKDKEEVFLHAERDLVIEVDHNQTRTVEGMQTTTIDGKGKEGAPKVSDELTVKAGNQTVTLEKGNQTVTLEKGDQTVTLDKGSQTVEIFKDQKLTLKTGNQTTDVKAGKVTIKAAQSIELKVGTNSIKIDLSGVTIKGTMLKVEGKGMAEVKSPMTTVKGDGMLTLKGGMTMIN
jgi:type VI secretion system secreted protein VgrG